jgi:hypothetical protein
MVKLVTDRDAAERETLIAAPTSNLPALNLVRIYAVGSVEYHTDDDQDLPFSKCVR